MAPSSPSTALEATSPERVPSVRGRCKFEDLPKLEPRIAGRFYLQLCFPSPRANNCPISDFVVTEFPIQERKLPLRTIYSFTTRWPVICELAFDARALQPSRPQGRTTVRTCRALNARPRCPSRAPTPEADRMRPSSPHPFLPSLQTGDPQ